MRGGEQAIIPGGLITGIQREPGYVLGPLIADLDPGTFPGAAGLGALAGAARSAAARGANLHAVCA